MNNIRNFCVIAHIDHGKSTLADRFLELTKTIPKEKLRAQFLDRMSLERERGITIKMHPVRMSYKHSSRINADQNADKRGLLYGDLTHKIRETIFNVYNKLGPSYKENIYGNALEVEFKKNSLLYDREKIINVIYDDKKIGIYKPDFIIDDKIILEIKAQPFLEQLEIKQTWHYLKGSRYRLALLVNFGTKELQIKRIIYDIVRDNPHNVNSREPAQIISDDPRSNPRQSAQIEDYILNLIDTPGHVDFSYEVRRGLNGCEGAILLVDATQGIQAQTLANYYLAKEEGLTIIPAVNKIDLPNAQPEKVCRDLAVLTGVPENEIIFVSAKSGVNAEKILQAVVEKIPAPRGDTLKPLRALVFDSLFDRHRGVIAFVRIFDGCLKKGEQIKLLGSQQTAAVLETGIFKPDFVSQESLSAGEIGYVVTGFRGVKDCGVGDTIVKIYEPETTPLKTYQEPQPMVFSGFYCAQSEDYSKFKEALERLSLNDAAFSFQPENFSGGLGFGFRCGFLGMLHLEIIKERLKREYGLDLIVAAPNVAYKIIFRDGTEKIIRSVQEFSEAESFKEIQEPWLKTEVFAPLGSIGPIMNLLKKFRGVYQKTEHLGERIRLFCELPLVSLLNNFFDELKNVSAGYGSLNYQFLGYRPGDLVKMSIRVAGKIIDALSFIIPRNEVNNEGKRLTLKLKKLLPRQLFEVAIQACVGSQIISRETVPALKKNVTAKLYGGDRSRKTKLWKKQQAGKKKLKEMGSVKIPKEIFFEAIKR